MSTAIAESLSEVIFCSTGDCFPPRIRRSDLVSGQQLAETHGGRTNLTITSFPERVQTCLRILREVKVCHIVSWNPVALSCPDAASKRWRFNGVGIPLCHELKSLIYRYRQDGQDRYVVVHCRGDQRIENSNLKQLLGSKSQSVPADELAEKFDAEFGAVNPVLLSRFPEVRQIVDSDVMSLSSGTMMTNAGGREHSIEFFPRLLFRALRVHEVANLTGTPGCYTCQCALLRQ